MFVALICMGVIIPVIFITLFLIFFYKRRKENRERSQEMLLREQPELSMDDCGRGEKTNKDDVPDLQLRSAPV
ncbi:unnamed protein product [Lymnaea stagnalis]|uniref:Uncharacterized protein n=1 Tax=Lymnaea stagnalis TaxID=6523 RepID=A0AAV2H834_LYMST